MTRQIITDYNSLSKRAMLPALIALSATLAACQTTRSKQTPLFGNGASTVQTGSLARPNNILLATTEIARKWQKNHGNASIGLQYAAQLKNIGSHDKALAILRQTAMRNPQNQTVMLLYGNQLAHMNQLSQAHSVLQKAQRAGKPNWRVYTAQGAVLDKMGKHDRAQVAYKHALNLAPGKPAIINNIAMSHAMGGKLKRAETTLRPIFGQPNANPKIRQNMALIVGLQGRFKEAKKIASKDLPPQAVKANIAYLRQMLAQPNSWKTVKNLNRP